LTSDEDAYAAVLDKLFTPQAAMSRPLCIARPRDTEQVATIVRTAGENQCAVTVCGGGLSTLCAQNRAIMIDLKRHLGGGRLADDHARMGGGATMGQTLDVLFPISRVIPIGAVGIPGMGLATQGGFGHLTRSMGLTLDHIAGVEIVAANGEIVALSAKSTGDEADLWWAVRGCAPNFGVVTSVDFRSQPLDHALFAHRALISLEAFPHYVEWAASLPNDVGAGAVLSRPPSASDAMLFTYVVYSGTEEARCEDIRNTIRRVASQSGGAPAWEEGECYEYRGLPAMDPPELDGRAAPDSPVQQRVSCAEKCPLVKGLTAEVAARLILLVRSAPTPYCRLDFQHAGGVASKPSPSDTAFVCREADWNCPLIAGWTDTSERAACERWLAKVWDALESCIAGAYSVEIRPGLPETQHEVLLAFGSNLERLRVLKKRWDPDNIFRLYYPLG